MGSVYEMAHLAGVYEEGMALPHQVGGRSFLISCDEPEADGDWCCIEELPRQGYHAINEVGLDNVLSYLSFTGLI